MLCFHSRNRSQPLTADNSDRMLTLSLCEQIIKWHRRKMSGPEKSTPFFLLMPPIYLSAPVFLLRLVKYTSYWRCMCVFNTVIIQWLLFCRENTLPSVSYRHCILILIPIPRVVSQYYMMETPLYTVVWKGPFYNRLGTNRGSVYFSHVKEPLLTLFRAIFVNKGYASKNACQKGPLAQSCRRTVFGSISNLSVSGSLENLDIRCVNGRNLGLHNLHVSFILCNGSLSL